MNDQPKKRDIHHSTIVIYLPRPLKGEYVRASRNRGMKLADWIIEQFEREVARTKEDTNDPPV